MYIDIPKLLVTRMLVQANSGGGKSYAVRVLAEQSMHHVQTIVIDPDGEFASLRELHDVLLVGEGGDLPADPLGATLLARRLFEKRCSAVIDLYELDPDDRELFVKDFFASLVTIPREDAHPMLVILDEAQDFCPERSFGTSVATQAVVSLMTRGRKRGIGLCLASQRMSSVSKSASSPANNYLFGRTVQDTDRNRVAKDLGLEKADRDGLRNLEEGQFWALGPAFSHKDCRKIRVAEAETTHPEVGTAMPPPPPASKRIRALIGREFSDLPERAQEEAATLGEASGAIRRLEKDNADLRKKLDGVNPDAERRLRGVQDELERMVKLAAESVEDLDRVRERLTGVKPKPASPSPRISSPEPKPSSRSPPHRRASPRANGRELLAPAQGGILDALAWWSAVGVAAPTRKQVAFVVGMSPRTKSHNNRISALKVSGLLDYPDRGQLALTDKGRNVAVPPDKPGTTKDLHKMVLGRLDPAMQDVLKPVLEVYPDSLTRGKLADICGMSPRTKSHNNRISALKTLGTLSYPRQGEVVASPMMFLN